MMVGCNSSGSDTHGTPNMFAHTPKSNCIICIPPMQQPYTYCATNHMLLSNQRVAQCSQLNSIAPRVNRQKQPKVGMGPEHPGGAPCIPCLIEQEATVWFKQGVEPIQDGCWASVGALQKHPVATLDGSGQHAVHPLKPG